MNETLIRPETAADIDAIRAINVAAFTGHPRSRQTEHLIVDALRDDGALSVSLVAVREDQCVGHIAFSEAAVGGMASGWYLAGPVGVLPEFQHQGIGSMLVLSGLGELRARQAAGCVLVGDPGFYQRFGFDVHPGLVHQGVPNEFVLALSLGDKAPTGEIKAHRAFEIQPEKSKADPSAVRGPPSRREGRMPDSA
jgi:predicted N-acetyltransferase YhbS